MRKFIIRSSVFIGIVTLIMTSYLYKHIFSPLSQEDQIILIPTNSSFEQVKDTLQNYGLVKNEFVFDLFCENKNYKKMRPGRYLIPAEMDANTMVNMLRLGEQKPLNIIFNNASSLQDLAGKLATQIEADSIALYGAFTDSMFYSTYGYYQASMRKLFIPNTYEMYWTVTPVEFLERMQKEYKRFWSEDRLRKATKLGLNPHEVSVLASIVQKESVKVDEQPIVAGLYLNRLSQGMKLQSDPTVIYSIKERDGFDAVIKRVLKKDLKIDSPYNTYYYKGLPPNPICIPEMSALVAVLNSKKHDYIYMCAKDDFSGYHNFTKFWSVHKRNAKLFQNALSAKGVMR